MQRKEWKMRLDAGTLERHTRRLGRIGDREQELQRQRRTGARSIFTLPHTGGVPRLSPKPERRLLTGLLGAGADVEPEERLLRFKWQDDPPAESPRRSSYEAGKRRSVTAADGSVTQASRGTEPCDRQPVSPR
ncbi:hypothetical protein CRENBAI_026534 [Crenichthys baileyi]|uniref:Uncharacterized protein n=1 Tax=Crenichthys baileyi TaxID=28760 RepID=A0AAV9R7Y6_9TELE